MRVERGTPKRGWLRWGEGNAPPPVPTRQIPERLAASQQPRGGKEEVFLQGLSKGSAERDASTAAPTFETQESADDTQFIYRRLQALTST